MENSGIIMQKNAVELINQYKELGTIPKAIVQILAIQVKPSKLTPLLNCLFDLQIKTQSGLRFSVVSIQPYQNELIQKGLLEKTIDGLHCHESIRVPVLHDTLLGGTFSDIALRVKQNMKALTQFHYFVSQHTSSQSILKALQLAVFYANEIEPFIDICRYAEKFNYFSGGNLYEEIISLFGNPLNPDIIGKINPSIREKLLSDVLYFTFMRIKSTQPLLDSFQALQKQTKSKSKDLSPTIQLMVYFTEGSVSKIQKLLSHFDLVPGSPFYSFLASLEFLMGNYSKSLSMFTENLKILKKKTRKRKIFLESFPSYFHLLSLLKNGEGRLLKEGLTHIETAMSQGDGSKPAIGHFIPVFEEQLGYQITHSVDPWYFDFSNMPMSFVMAHITSSWINKKKAKKEISTIQSMRDKALTADYLWMAAELSALLAFLGHSKGENQAMADEIHKKCGTKSIIDCVTKRPEWEKKLTALLNLSEGIQEKAVAEQRLIWWLTYMDEEDYYVTPRLQKQAKKGGWTKGRPVSLKTLKREHLSYEGLTDQDHKVCECIEEYVYSRYYGSGNYDMNHNLAMPILVDHPLVFLEDSPQTRVELISVEPEIHLKKEHGELKLQVFPPELDADKPTTLIRETTTRYKLITLTKKQQEILEYLNEDLIIPRSGKKLVQQVINAISSVFTVQSDMETGQKIKTEQGDSKPHIHIIPWNDGINLEFLVMPSGEHGSSFHPGKGGQNVLSEVNGKKMQVTRNLSEEVALKEQVINTCPTLKRLEEFENQRIIDDPEEALEVLTELKECGDHVLLEWPKGQKITVHSSASFSQFSMSIKKDRDWFKATGNLKINSELSLNLKHIMELLSKTSNRFIPLDDGTFLALTNQLRQRLEELAVYSEAHGNGLRFSPLIAPALEEFMDEVGTLRSDNEWKAHNKRLQEVVKPEVPSTLQASLRDYQVTGFHWLAQLSHWGVGACLADDMGLGKTVQALSAILLRASKGPTLVVAPLSVLSNWVDEAKKFAPTIRVVLFGQGDRIKMVEELKPFDMLIVSYGLLPLESDLLSSVAWQTVVLDEAQAIKNSQTKRSKAAMTLQSEFKIITTGTPLENHLGELWSLFQFLNPGLLGSFKRFNERFAIPIEQGKSLDAKNQLRKLIRPFTLRRLKSEVLTELPPKTEITLTVEMSEEEQLLYEAQRLKALNTLQEHQEDGAGQQHLRILGEIMKLRRLCCNPNLVLPELGIKSSKLKVFGNTLRELLDNNHKALVFSQFVGHLEIIRHYLESQGISYQYLDGSTPVKKRKERIAGFQNGEGDIFLISLKAGGSGLNLTAADYVIHMDPWWNPAVEDQASDRVHRIGQDRPVTVYRLVMKGTIEEQIINLHQEKRALADSLLEGTDSAGKMSAKELLALLQD